MARPVEMLGDETKALTKGRKPVLAVEQLRALGVRGDSDSPPGTKAKLLVLEQPDNTRSHWLGYHNFYVITRYNLSHKYAMAIHHLSREILARRQKP